MEEGKGTPDRSSNVENNNSGNTNGINVPQEPPTREITQTDHLNKKLLNSFLDKINESSGFPIAVAICIVQCHKWWEDNAQSQTASEAVEFLHTEHRLLLLEYLDETTDKFQQVLTDIKHLFQQYLQ
ncbi:hypothetical protein LSAT2_009851 [Lamellibrachia satsuma]|nr:hypothetical protein LSAT2_009851 [Lamellibrachia satsuma]